MLMVLISMLRLGCVVQGIMEVTSLTSTFTRRSVYHMVGEDQEWDLSECELWKHENEIIIHGNEIIIHGNEIIIHGNE